MRDDYWTAYADYYTGVYRSALITLQEGKVYRFRLRSLSAHCGYSAWSNVIYVSTPKNLTAVLEIQGTGMYNPLDSYVKLNGTTLYKGSFVGLQLFVLNRCDLSLVKQAIYDTFNYEDQANAMAGAIRSYNSNYLVFLISSYAWGANFNKNLSEAITELGGYLTKSIVNLVPPTPIYKLPSPINYGYPYAFIGVPGQYNITGQNFEVLRNNTQYFNYNDALFNAIPTARIRVNLIFDTYRQFYFLKDNRAIRINKY